MPPPKYWRLAELRLATRKSYQALYQITVLLGTMLVLLIVAFYPSGFTTPGDSSGQRVETKRRPRGRPLPSLSGQRLTVCQAHQDQHHPKDLRVGSCVLLLPSFVATARLPGDFRLSALYAGSSPRNSFPLWAWKGCSTTWMLKAGSSKIGAQFLSPVSP